jgi:hypothetical protein
MSRKIQDHGPPRDVADLRARLRPYQQAAQAALDFALKAPTFALADGKSLRAFDVVVEDEAFYTRTVLLRHAKAEAPSDPIATAIALAGAPGDAPEDWDLASSACKAGYGSEVRAHCDGTAVDLTAKIVVSRGLIVAAGDPPSSLEAAVGASHLEWPRQIDGWTFSSRRGLEAFDAEPIEIDAEQPAPESQPILPSMGM